MTALDIIKRAMRICGVIGQNETPTSSEADDGLVALNDMLDSWSTDRTYIYSILQENFPLSAGVVTYTIGTGGTFNTNRPVAIDNVFIRLNGADFPVKEINSQDYNSITVKTSNGGIPQYYFYNPAFPLATISLWGAPSAGTVIYLNTWQQMTQFADLATDYSLPQGYTRALVYALAMEIAPEYGTKLTNEAMAIAMVSQANIRNKNLPAPIMKTEIGLIGNNNYNYVTDGYY
jgi:hypothetical protein